MSATTQGAGPAGRGQLVGGPAGRPIVAQPGNRFVQPRMQPINPPAQTGEFRDQLWNAIKKQVRTGPANPPARAIPIPPQTSRPGITNPNVSIGRGPAPLPSMPLTQQPAQPGDFGSQLWNAIKKQLKSVPPDTLQEMSDVQQTQPPSLFEPGTQQQMQDFFTAQPAPGVQEAQDFFTGQSMGPRTMQDYQSAIFGQSSPMTMQDYQSAIFGQPSAPGAFNPQPYMGPYTPRPDLGPGRGFGAGLPAPRGPGSQFGAALGTQSPMLNTVGAGFNPRGAVGATSGY